MDVDGIVNHGETLTNLLIVNGGIHRADETRFFNASDLQNIAIACPILKQLCLNLYEIDPGKSEGDTLGPRPGNCHETTEFEHAISHIASMSSLRVLRFINPPNYRRAYHRPGEFMRFFRRSLEIGDQRHAFQAHANGVMRFLGDHRSAVEVLAFAPIEKPKEATLADKNGHVWPNYYYGCGEMLDQRGTSIAVACTLADWKTEVAYATILEDV